MKRIIPTIMLALTASAASAQISIDATDMPAVGDTLRYSVASPTSSGINLADSGQNISWSFSSLTAIAQSIDTYKTAAQVNISYGITISPTAFGYKVADTFPIPSSIPVPISIKNVYTFFNVKSSPSRYIAEAFAAEVSGFPVPANYQDEDELFIFPLAYGNEDSTTYKLDVSLPSLGSLKQEGYRKTKVDGWGTVITPFANAEPCVRVRSEVVGVDSISISSLSMSFGLPRHTVDYFWLVENYKYPAMWITTRVTGGNETITNIRYKDYNRGLAVNDISKKAIAELAAYPNPANESIKVTIPKGWDKYTVEVFNIGGQLVLQSANVATLDISALAQGSYMIRVQSGEDAGYAGFVKQ